MKCICIKKCYIPSPTGNSRLYYVGKVEDFVTCPTHFEPLDENEVDFAKAEKEELMEKKWKFTDAADAVKALYNVELKKGTKATMVSAILDARYRNT